MRYRSNTDLLRGMRSLEEHVSPQYPAIHCDQNRAYRGRIFSDLGDDNEWGYPYLYQDKEDR